MFSIWYNFSYIYIYSLWENQFFVAKNIKNAYHFIDSNLYRDSGTSVTLPKIHDESAREVAFRRLSDTDRILLENLDIDRCRSRQTGRFLTIHKRRRKKLITRSLSQEPGILDDIFHGLVQVIYIKMLSLFIVLF